MLGKDFTPYSESLALRELGFDEPCLGFFHEICEDNDKAGCSGKFQTMCGWVIGRETTNNLSSHDFIVVRPSYSQAFRFFREKYGLYQIIIQNTDNDWTYDVITIKGIGDFEILDVFHSYEEAELACLRKLIQTVKEQ